MGEFEKQIEALHKILSGLEAARSILGEASSYQDQKKIQEDIERLQKEIERLSHLNDDDHNQKGDSLIRGDFIGNDQNKLNIDSGDINGMAVVGNRNNIVIYSDIQQTESESLSRTYLTYIFETSKILQLAGIDHKLASDSNSNLSLAAVYTALMTETYIDQDNAGQEDLLVKNTIQLSAIEKMNRYSHLVLLGEPGSGKSTFINFVALCFAGEGLNHETINLKLLTSQLPEEAFGIFNSKRRSEPWIHGKLVPVRIVLRDFAARGLHSIGDKINARHLWDFIVAELSNINLEGFAIPLNKLLREQGGLLLLDGLDEVPEAEHRRVQIKQAIEDFSRCYPKVRILVTSRTYAYQNQSWQLSGFTTAMLAPFSQWQIKLFINRWYAHLANMRQLNKQDIFDRAESLKHAIFSNIRLEELAERPLLLTLMASLHAWRGGSLPEKGEELYADTVDLLLDIWERPKEVLKTNGQMVREPSLTEWLNVDRKKVREVLEVIAYESHKSQNDTNETADIPQSSIVKSLMELTNNPDVRPARLIEYLRDRAGLLLPRGNGIYAFPHRTFQEYLAACYLTNHDFPYFLAELACTDFNRWREVTLLAGAKAARGTEFAVWSLVDALCYEEISDKAISVDIEKQWGAHLAARILIENVGLSKVNERNHAKVDRVRAWLIYIINHCDLPAYERASSGNSLARLGDIRFRSDQWFLPDEPMLGFVEIPSGHFFMGSDPSHDSQTREDEQPKHKVELSRFFIARYPVTQNQYECFIEDGGYLNEVYWEKARVAGYWSEIGYKGPNDSESRTKPIKYQGSFDLPNHPVVGISWFEANAYCCWLNEKLMRESSINAKVRELLKTGWSVTLPTEAQWEKAARGTEGIIYPWGDIFDSEKANTQGAGITATSTVGCFPAGASSYGLMDMSGNVWNWCADWYDENYYKESPLQDPSGNPNGKFRVLRGGSWDYSHWISRSAYRYRYGPYNCYNDVGFRCVLSFHCPAE